MRHELKVKDCGMAGSSDLTVVAPIKKGFVSALDAVTYKSRVKRVLRTLHLGRTSGHEYEFARMLSDAVERVGRIHSVRIAVLEPEDVVLLAVTFDGAWESYVRVIWQKVARLLDLIFCNTEGYVNGWENSYEDWGRWLRWRQAETAFLYATPGLTVDDATYLRIQERLQRQQPAVDVEASRVTAPAAEEIAYQLFTDGTQLTHRGRGQPLSGLAEAKPAVFRQGLRSVVGLYRLAEVFQPGPENDDRVLLRAAQELLPDFARLLSGQHFLQTAWGRALDRFEEPMTWLLQTEEPPQPRRPPVLVDADLSEALQQVQGGVLKGYERVDHGVLLLLAFESPAALAELLTHLPVTTAAAQQAMQPGHLAYNLALSSEGLRLAGISDAEFEQLPTEFAQGMERRAGLLGDLRINHPRRWRLPARNWHLGTAAHDAAEDDPIARVALSAVHAVLQIRARAPDLKADPVARMNASSARADMLTALHKLVALHPGITPLSLQWMGRVQTPQGSTVEHFGFQDGASNPVLSRSEAGRFFSNQAHAGEILIGRDNAADAAPPASREPSWLNSLMQDGSFLVIRKLRQDVPLIEGLLEQALKTSSAPVADLGREGLLAKMMGRWPAEHASAGKPLVKLPAASLNANDFNYRADPDGAQCPLHAHIRRSNPRAAVASPLKAQMGDGARPPRLFRRGMPYGPWFDRAETDPDKRAAALKQERGLVFMAYGASIGEQFEVVQRWLAGGNSSGGHSSQSDPFLGLPEPGQPRTFRFEHQNSTVRLELDGSRDLLEEPRPLVRLEWGGYFLAPTKAGLQALRERALQTAAQKRPGVGWTVKAGEAAIAELLSIESTQGAEAAAMAWKSALEDPEAAADYTTASIWAAIREKRGGVLRTPYGVLVASRRWVDQVLHDRKGRFTSTAYLNRMRRSFGAIYLGMDAGQEDRRYETESQACNDAIMARDPADTAVEAFKAVTDWIEAQVKLARQHAQADETLRRALETQTPRDRVHWDLTIDVRELVDEMLATFCERWFGLSAAGGHLSRGGQRWSWQPGEPPRYPGHFMAPSRYIFQPHPGPRSEELGAAHGKAMLAAMQRFLASYGPQIQAPVTRAVLDSEPAASDPALAARTIIGAMMGLVPTVDANLRRILHLWLNDGTLWALREQAARLGREAMAPLLDAAFITAMQTRAAPDTLWRTVTTSHKLGAGSRHETAVAPGDIVVVGLLSATHECLEQGLPVVSYAFGGNRTDKAHPTHACPGYMPAMAMMQGFVAALVHCGLPLRAGPGPLTLALDGFEPWVATPDFLELVKNARRHSQAQPARLGGGPTPSGYQAAKVETALTPLWAFGDSWLTQDLPFFPELPSQLPARGYQVRYFEAEPGRRLADMAELAGEFALRLADDTIGAPPRKALLLGGGGNDIVFRPMNDLRKSWLYRMLVPGAKTAQGALDPQVMAEFIEGVLLGHYRTILNAMAQVAGVPILIHAYDYPVPDGKAAQILGFGSGPWLQPIFAERGLVDLNLNAQVMRILIDELNRMVAGLEKEYPGKVHHLKLTGTLVSDPGRPKDYRAYWDNELHPSEAGYRQLGVKIAAALRKLGV